MASRFASHRPMKNANGRTRNVTGTLQSHEQDSDDAQPLGRGIIKFARRAMIFLSVGPD